MSQPFARYTSLAECTAPCLHRAEVTSEMVRNGTSTLELKLVVLHQLVHYCLRIFASDGQVIDIGANVLPVVSLFLHPDVGLCLATKETHPT